MTSDISPSPDDKATDNVSEETVAPADANPSETEPEEEYGGRGGLEPTRYGDWEKDGLISDF